MAAEGQPGSKVVICTDGLANIGIGAFNELTAENMKLADEFYQQIGEIA